ncbi:hypothetical protein HN51_008774 [Arachis hypogaea]|uniref:Chromo domain-containing protein n=1 Tax=Arachis hypogaea TaxID=3818 RepID=A0A445D2J6_ARAHY|nr:chromo domain-containing protein LHP1-like [Arachis hypogaea]RYR57264.1 hypothetical protein Ahy_A05g022988 [Arachis hypogaea]
MPPKKDNDDRAYEVHSICRKRIHRGKLQYMLKWNGWEDVSNTWETSESLEHVRDHVNEFDARIKSRIIENLKKRNKEKASSSRPFITNQPPRFSKEEEESKEKEDKKEDKKEKQEETKDDKDDSDYDVNVKVSPGVSGGAQIQTDLN